MAVRRAMRRSRIIRITNSRRRTNYYRYMRSPAWREYKIAWWATYDKRHKVRRCYICGITQQAYGKVFDLHHRTYDRLGKEAFDDLVPLCRQPCHQRVTKAWRARHKTRLLLTLWELTDYYRDQARASASHK